LLQVITETGGFTFSDPPHEEEVSSVE